MWVNIPPQAGNLTRGQVSHPGVVMIQVVQTSKSPPQNQQPVMCSHAAAAARGASYLYVSGKACVLDKEENSLMMSAPCQNVTLLTELFAYKYLRVMKCGPPQPPSSPDPPSPPAHQQMIAL